MKVSFDRRRAGVIARFIWIVGTALLASQALQGSLNGAEDGPAADGTIPPALKSYKGRQIAVTMHFEGAPWLTRESREREEECSTLLKQLGVQPGQTVCDMGCGNGFYTLELAKLVGPSGEVLAVDIQPEMLTLLKERAKSAGIANVKPTLGTLVDPMLPKGDIDLILLVDVYHEFSHPEHMLRAMRESLKPEGRMALVEFRLEDRNVPIKLLHKMSKKQIMKELRPNGFKLVEEFNGLPWQHVMFFARDDAKQPAIEPKDERARKRIGQALEETIYEDQLTAKDADELRTQTSELFLRPLMEKYRRDHADQLQPTEEEIKAATKYFQERQAKRLAEEQPSLAGDIKKIEAELQDKKLPAERRKELEKKLDGLKSRAKPLDESFARFWLPNQLLQMHLYQNYGGGRLLFQQFGTEAFDATHAFIKEQERLGNLTFDRPEHREAALHYYTRSHGAFLWDPAEQPERSEEFVNPPWLKRSLKIEKG